MLRRPTRRKISDRELCKACDAAEAWMANTRKVDRSLARRLLHRLIRPLVVFHLYKVWPSHRCLNSPQQAHPYRSDTSESMTARVH